MDNITALKDQHDTQDMYGKIAAMADHLEDGASIGRDVDLHNIELETYNTLVVSGVGGSAIAGDIARSYLYPNLKIPFMVQRHYRPPGFVNRKTLVICSSYSGNTEETLEAYDDAIERGARVLAMTTGGRLVHKASSDNVSIVRIPNGLPPRAALGYSFAPLLTIISRLGLCDDPIDDIRQMAKSMRDRLDLYKPDSEDNPALALAREIHGTIPIIYAGYDNFDSVAARFKGQICENAKCLAFFNLFPEFNHNELVGWGELYDFKDKLIAIIIKDKEDHKRIKARMEIVARYLEDRGLKVITLLSEDGSLLERIFLMIQLLDFASYYLALLNGVNPYPVRAIDYLKEKLSEIK